MMTLAKSKTIKACLVLTLAAGCQVVEPESNDTGAVRATPSDGLSTTLDHRPSLENPEVAVSDPNPSLVMPPTSKFAELLPAEARAVIERLGPDAEVFENLKLDPGSVERNGSTAKAVVRRESVGSCSIQVTREGTWLAGPCSGERGNLHETWNRLAGVDAGIHTIAQFSRWLSQNPGRLFKLRVGADESGQGGISLAGIAGLKIDRADFDALKVQVVSDGGIEASSALQLTALGRSIPVVLNIEESQGLSPRVTGVVEIEGQAPALYLAAALARVLEGK